MENNKILLEISIPSIEKSYDVFVPISKRIGTIKTLFEKGVIDLTNHDYVIKEDTNLYSKETGKIYDVNMKIIDSDLENGSRLILL
jgi:hypothetical protein